MTENSLRNRLIRLAYEDPEIRPKVLPLLRKSSLSGTLGRAHKLLQEAYGRALDHVSSSGADSYAEDISDDLDDIWSRYVAKASDLLYAVLRVNPSDGVAKSLSLIAEDFSEVTRYARRGRMGDARDAALSSLADLRGAAKGRGLR
jgi:hypothetical protein